MQTWSLNDWSSVAQVVATLVSFVGIAVAIWLGIRASREMALDRRLRHRPYLAFEPGGHRVRIEFVTIGTSVPGVEPTAAKRLLGHLARDGESVALVRDDAVPGSGRYGQLKNFGVGPGMQVRVEWVPERVFIGSDSFEVTADKRMEALYSRGLNAMPTLPSHVEPGGAAQLTRLPAFIVKDYDKKTTRVEGYFVISCRDVFGGEHKLEQTFHLFTHYREQKPTVRVTFSDPRSDESAA